jgi:hypothetical protein
MSTATPTIEAALSAYDPWQERDGAVKASAVIEQIDVNRRR